MLSRAGSPCPPFGLEMPPSYPEPAGEPLEQSSQPPAEQQKAALQNHQERKQSPPHTPSRAPCAWGCAEGPGEPFNTQRPLSTGALGRKGRRVSTKRLVFGSAHGSDFALPCVTAREAKSRGCPCWSRTHVTPAGPCEGSWLRGRAAVSGQERRASSRGGVRVCARPGGSRGAD